MEKNLLKMDAIHIFRHRIDHTTKHSFQVEFSLLENKKMF